MIKASELRVGNWVKHAGTITPLQVDVYSFVRMEEWFEEYDPIPLTPEILEKCGFEAFMILDDQQDYRGEYLAKSGFRLYIDPGEKCYYFRYGDTELYPVEKHEIEIKFLHELQNLYFALTGEELEVNLNAEVSDTNKA